MSLSTFQGFKHRLALALPEQSFSFGTAGGRYVQWTDPLSASRFLKRLREQDYGLWHHKADPSKEKYLRVSLINQRAEGGNHRLINHSLIGLSLEIIPALYG